MNVSKRILDSNDERSKSRQAWTSFAAVSILAVLAKPEAVSPAGTT